VKILRDKRFGLIIMGLLFLTAVVVGIKLNDHPYTRAKEDTTKIKKAHQKKYKVSADNLPKALGVVGERDDPTYADVTNMLNQANYQGSILIVKNGKPVWQQGFGKMNENESFEPDAPIALASITKNVTAYLLMKALTEKGLTLDTPLSTFYPKLPNANQTTLRQLIRMDAPYKGAELSDQDLAESQYIKYYLKHVKYVPGNKNWSYNATDYQILTGVLTKLTGKSYNQLVTENLTEKYGVLNVDTFETLKNRPTAKTQDGKWKKFNQQRFNREVGTGNLFMSPWNMYRLLHDEIQGKNLTADEFKEMTLPRAEKPFGYSAGMYRRPFGYQLHGALQSFEPSVLLDSEGENGVVLFSNQSLGKMDDKFGKPIFDIVMKQVQEGV